MWAIRILNGPQAGQVFNLKLGKNRLGRGASCDIQLNNPGISKEHLEIQVLPDKILISDLRSSNGTFLNGVRIQNGLARMGDKLSADRLMFDIVMAQAAQPQALVPVQNSTPMPQNTSFYAQTQTLQQPMPSQSYDQDPYVPAPMPQSMGGRFQSYLDEVVLPGLYQLPQVFEFRTVIFGFALVFILSVTLLSLIPMNRITAESIQTESRRRALTVARALANANETGLRQGALSSYSTDLVLKEEGIDEVYIISKDGTILAPPERSGDLAKDTLGGFFASFRGKTNEVSGTVGIDQIGAAVPILIFDPDLQQNVAKAYTVVIYNAGSMKFDEGRALSLFVQTLAIALVIGGILFFLMYKLIEYPLVVLQKELDQSLREGRDHAVSDLKFPLMEQVLVSINSLLTRVVQGGGAAPGASHISESEATNIAQMIGYPAAVFSKSGNFVSVNTGFESLTGVNAMSIQGQALQFLPDQALQKNIQELMSQSQRQHNVIQTDRLDISGQMFRLNCQALGVAGDVQYFIVCIMPDDQAQGGAA